MCRSWPLKATEKSSFFIYLEIRDYFSEKKQGSLQNVSGSGWASGKRNDYEFFHDNLAWIKVSDLFFFCPPYFFTSGRLCKTSFTEQRPSCKMHRCIFQTLLIMFLHYPLMWFNICMWFLHSICTMQFDHMIILCLCG